MSNIFVADIFTFKSGLPFTVEVSGGGEKGVGIPEILIFQARSLNNSKIC